MALNYFYDNQIRRYVEQVQRIFSGFQIHLGKDSFGSDRYYTVPCIYGDSSRVSQHIARQNSENTMLPVPFFAIYDSDVETAPERRQNTNFVGKEQVIERKFDEETQTYSNTDGYRYTVERFMPIPYNMTFNVDLWFTQTDHKLQLCEQIMMLFNDEINIQTGTNPLDWTAITTMKMAGITWQSRGVPAGIDDALRIVSFTFEVPIWINPPSKVKKQKLIETIITNIHNTTIDDSSNIRNSWEGILNINPENLDQIFTDGSLAQRSVITPGNHYIQVDNGEVSLLGQDQSNINPNTGNPWEWETLLDEYGELRDNISLLRLRPVSDIEETSFDYIGRLQYHPSDPNKLLWNVDLETIPQDTLTTISGVIDPTLNEPGGDLPLPSNGTRYLLVNDLATPTAAWGSLTANENDIIEFNGAVWSVSFDASAATGDQYVTNGISGSKLSFDSSSKEWSLIPDGIWSPGWWRLML